MKCRGLFFFRQTQKNNSNKETKNTTGKAYSPVFPTEPTKDHREVVQQRSQRVHHTEILYSPWNGQHQSPPARCFLEMAKNIKVNGNLKQEENMNAITGVDYFSGSEDLR